MPWPYVPDLALSSDEVEMLVTAYHKTREALGYGDDDNPLTRAIAHAVVEEFKEGERDSEVIAASVLYLFRTGLGSDAK